MLKWKCLSLSALGRRFAFQSFPLHFPFHCSPLSEHIGETSTLGSDHHYHRAWWACWWWWGLCGQDGWPTPLERCCTCLSMGKSQFLLLFYFTSASWLRCGRSMAIGSIHVHFHSVSLDERTHTKKEVVLMMMCQSKQTNCLLVSSFLM